MNDPLMIGSLTILEIQERLTHLTEQLFKADIELNYYQSDKNCPADVIEDTKAWISELELARREYFKALDQLPPL